VVRSGSSLKRPLLNDQASPVEARRLWRKIQAVLAVAVRRWLAPRTSLFAAALAFHALLALAPVLLVLLPAASRLLGRETVRSSLDEAAVRFAGPGADRVVSSLVGMVEPSRLRATGTLVGVALLIYFASTFFAQLRVALNAVWEVRPRSFGRSLVDRATSFGQTLLALIAMLLVLAAGVARSMIHPMLPEFGEAGALAWMAWTRLGTLLMTAALLAAAYRFVPSSRPRLGAVAVGAIPAALILNMASELFAFVISRSALASLYGTAGSLIMFLLWVHYSAWIVLLGAELCRAWGEAAPAASG
jgi:membrane protein